MRFGFDFQSFSSMWQKVVPEKAFQFLSIDSSATRPFAYLDHVFLVWHYAKKLETLGLVRFIPMRHPLWNENRVPGIYLKNLLPYSYAGLSL